MDFSKHVLGVDLLSWNVPFFSFIMIVALGVDYSIFLMMRYREQENSQSAIVEAAKHIGGVVISAAIILGGTFAALMPSGVVTINPSCHRGNHWTLFIKLCHVTNLDSGLAKFTVFIDSYIIKSLMLYKQFIEGDVTMIQNKREAILKAAMELFGELGYDGTTMPMIADRAKVGAESHSSLL